MREYIESLENAGEKHSETAWREIISKEIDDIKRQDPDAEIVDIDEAIKALDADGYIITTAATEMLADAPMETIVEYMDDEIREAVHAELAPCTEEEFLAEYMQRHYEKYGEQFTI